MVKFKSHLLTYSTNLFLIFLFAMMSPKESEGATKTVYLIRHAESEENRRIASLSRCFGRLSKFSLPTSSDIAASTELLNVTAQVDSNVSEIGAKQIAQMAEKLKEVNFLSTTGVKLVAHSPLLRARETSEGMLGCVAPDTKADSVDRVVEIDLLAEKTPSEWTPMYYSSFKKRIANFENWLAEQSEETVALVGHSQYFKAMLGLDFKFGNCDVWQLTFDPSKLKLPTTDSSDTQGAEVTLASIAAKEESSTDKELHDTPSWNLPPQWSDLKSLYACEVEGSKKA
jgi:broad specificity phosphatase PhoE